LECRCHLVYKLRQTYLKSESHLGFSTSGYLLTFDYHQYNVSGMSLVKSVSVANGRLFPTSVVLKMYYMLFALYKLYILLPVWSRYIGHLVGARLVLFSSSCSLVKFTITPSGYEMAAKTVAWAYFYFPCISNTKVK